ncbi:8052_t:CDS:2, partial [Dentiscutata erythropus]
MSETSNPLQQLQKYIIEKNINSYDYTCFRNVKLIKNERFTRVYRAIFENKITIILKSFENNNPTINEVINENVNGGTLRSCLHENSQHLSWNDIIKFSFQIASAVRHLHSKGIFNLGL